MFFFGGLQLSLRLGKFWPQIADFCFSRDYNQVSCKFQATIYGKCISVKEPNLKRYDCTKEFEELKRCFDRNMKSMK